MVGSWKISSGVELKMTANAHMAFLKEHLQPRCKRLRITFERTMIFMYDNSPSHSAEKTTEYLQQMGFCGPHKMKCSAYSPDLNPIENS